MKPSRLCGMLAVAGMMSAGCIPNDQYDKVLDEKESLELVNQGLVTENDRLRKELDDTSLLHRYAEATNASERDKALASQVAFSQLSQRTQELLNKIKGASGEQWTIDPESGVITLADTVLFDTGSGELRKQGEEVLRRLAEALKIETASGRFLRIDGHTDDQPVVVHKETYPTNWHLSGARALNVLLFFQSLGIDPGRMSYAGYGEHRPREANAKGRKGSKKNRRVEIVVLDRLNTP